MILRRASGEGTIFAARAPRVMENVAKGPGRQARLKGQGCTFSRLCRPCMSVDGEIHGITVLGRDDLRPLRKNEAALRNS